MLQQLLSLCSQYSEPILQDEGMVTSQPVLHELPVRPSYERQPPQELYGRVRSLSNPIFKQTLSDEERKSIIEQYPTIQGLKYSPPSAVPEAQRRITKGQAREDSALRSLQYSASAILRPFDTMCHELLQATANEESERLFAIVNDIRTLILHHCGAITMLVSIWRYERLTRQSMSLTTRLTTLWNPQNSKKPWHTTPHTKKPLKMPLFVVPSRFFPRTQLTGVEGVPPQPPTSQLPISHDDYPTSQPTTVVHPTTIATTAATPTATPTTLPTTTDSRRPPTTFFPGLGSSNRQPMAPFGHSGWLQGPLPKTSTIIQQASTYYPLQQRTTPTFTTRNCGSISQTGHRTGSGIGISRFLQPNVL
jgi:hypothetical protein